MKSLENLVADLLIKDTSMVLKLSEVLSPLDILLK